MPARARMFAFPAAALLFAALLSGPVPAAADSGGAKIDLRIHGASVSCGARGTPA